MRTRRLTAIAIMAALVSVTSLTGCGVAEQAVEDVTGVQVDGDSVSVPGVGDVTLETGPGELPEGFPADFPIKSGAEITGGSSVTVDGATTYQTSLLVDGSIQEAHDWWRAELEKSGYAIEGAFMQGNPPDQNGVITATKNGTRATIATSDNGDGRAAVEVMITGVTQ